MARMAGAGLGERLRRQAGVAGVAVDDRLVERLCAYVDLLARWNARLNLTRLDRDDAGLARLAVEPLVALPYLPAEGRLIDIGSGGGSPAIPLKLAAPHLALRMVEAKARKSAFLREAVRRLNLDRAEVLTERYEALLARGEPRHAHAALAVRGVRVDGRVLMALESLVAPGGVLLLFRGREAADAWPGAVPGLTREAAIPLGPSPGSRLIVLRRRPGVAR